MPRPDDACAGMNLRGNLESVPVPIDSANTGAERKGACGDVMDQHRTDEELAREERRIREAALDKTLADTFPASDPLSSNPNPHDYSIIETDEDTTAH
jgi:hypothetical protein